MTIDPRLPPRTNRVDNRVRKALKVAQKGRSAYCCRAILPGATDLFAVRHKGLLLVLRVN